MVDLPPGFRIKGTAAAPALPPGFRVKSQPASGFQPVNNGAGEQIGGFSMPTATGPLNVMVQSTATPPGPAPMTPQQMQSMNLPVPDGQGGIDPRYSSDDHGTPVQPEVRAPEDGGGRALDIALQGLRQGAGELVGFPVDMASAALNLGAMGVDAAVGGDQSWMRSNNPIGGSHQINEMIEGVVPGEPFSYDEMTDAQRLGFEANRFGVQSVVPSGFLSHPAVRQALGKMAPAIAPTVEGLSRPYQTGATMVNDAVAGVGGGIGYGAYDTQAPDWVKDNPVMGPLGDMFASMGGAVGANMIQNAGEASVRTAANVGRSKFDTNLPQNPDGSFVAKRDADVAAMYAQDAASNPQQAADVIRARSNNLASSGPRSAIPSSGVLSDDPGLVAYEKGFRLDPTLHKDFVANQQATETAALNSAKQIAPETAVGRQFTDAVQADDAQRVAQAEARVRAADQDMAGADERNMRLAADLTAKRGTSVAASERLDKAIVDETLVPMQGESSPQFAAADPDGQSMVASDPMLEAADRVYQSLGELNTPAKVIPQGLLQRIEGTAGEVTPATSVDTGILDASGRPITRDTPQMQAPNEVSVRSILDALPELATTEERARRAGNYTLADNIRDLRRSMDTTLDQAATAGNPEAAAAVAARQNYKDTVGSTFGGGVNDPALKLRKDFNLDRFNRTTTQPSQTAKRFLVQGQPEKAESLKRILANSPVADEGRAAVSDFLAADLAKVPNLVGKNGVVDKVTLERWAAQWGDEALDIPADFRAQLNGLIVRAGENAADTSTLATQLKVAHEAQEDALRNKGAIARVLGKDPVNAVSSLLQSGDPQMAVRAVVERIAGNDSALGGLKASVREYLMERATTSAIQKTTTGENPLSFAKLDDLFKANEDALSEVFSPAEMNSLRTAHQFLAPLKNLEMRTVVGSQTSANDRMWDQISKPVEVALKLRFGVLKGGGLMRTLGLWREMMPNGDKAAIELINRMWFDPELAQHLLTRQVDQVNSARYNAKLIWLLSVGAGAREINSEETE